MIKVDQQVAQCLNRLRSAEFAPLVGAMQDSLASDLEALSTARDIDTLRQTQGAAQFLKGFLRLIEDAENLVVKTSRP